MGASPRGGAIGLSVHGRGRGHAADTVSGRVGVIFVVLGVDADGAAPLFGEGVVLGRGAVHVRGFGLALHKGGAPGSDVVRAPDLKGSGHDEKLGF